jgi:hypothetical protein
MHLYSKLELVDPELRFLVEPDVPSIHARVRLRSNRHIDLHCVHPRPPAPTENPSSAERDAELLLVAKAVGETGRSALVVGDLNDVAWSATTRLFQKTSGMLDPRIGRGMFSTFHAKYALLRWPLDHIFISPEFTVVSIARLGYFGSDHFPICASLCYSPKAAKVQEAPKAGAEDRQIVEEKIDKVTRARVDLAAMLLAAAATTSGGADETADPVTPARFYVWSLSTRGRTTACRRRALNGHGGAHPAPALPHHERAPVT